MMNLKLFLILILLAGNPIAGKYGSFNCAAQIVSIVGKDQSAGRLKYAFGVVIWKQSNAVGSNTGTTPPAHLQGKLLFNADGTTNTTTPKLGAYIGPNSLSTHLAPLEFGVNNLGANATSHGIELNLAYLFVTQTRQNLYIQKSAVTGAALTEWQIGGTKYDNFVDVNIKLRAHLLKMADNAVIIWVIIGCEFETGSALLASGVKEGLQQVMADCVTGGGGSPDYIIINTMSQPANNPTHMATANGEIIDFADDDSLHRFVIVDDQLSYPTTRFVGDNLHYTGAFEDELAVRAMVPIVNSILPNYH
jgi:hypothetical protein